MRVALTRFALGRLFPKQKRGNTIQDCSAEEFELYLNEQAPLKVLDGYAEFCKLEVHSNWTSTRCLTIPITSDNRHLLRSGYEARSPSELSVLTRWFEGVQPPVANYLIPILYSRDQLRKEGEKIRAEWGVVGCLYTLEPVETPMAPITILRNALGIAEGGSGLALDRTAYLHSIEFWEHNATWRDPVSEPKS